MPSKYIFYYGPDPAKPYSLSLLLDGEQSYDPNAGPLSPAQIETLEAELQTAIPGDQPTANDIACLTAAVFQRCQPSFISWPRCSYYTTAGFGATPNDFEYVGDIQIPPNGSETTALNLTVGDIIAGMKGRTSPKAGTRIFAVGLLNTSIADTNYGQQFQNAGGTDNVSRLLRGFNALRTLYNGTGALAISGASTISKIFVPVTIGSFLFKGVRRS